MGIKDILIVDNKIGKIDDNIDLSGCTLEHEVIDLQGRYTVPGFIDPHVHIIGGGGEAGFHTRTPEVMLSGVVSAGITTLVGVLGTDGTTRHLESLFAKAEALETEGITAYMYTGSYQVPPITITGSIRKDIMLINRVIGTGEIAISDHRSSEPTKEELARIAAETRMGGMLSGKKSILNLHMGSGKGGLDVIFAILRDTEVPICHFVPTHVTRNPELFKQAMEFAKLGGTIDITAAPGPYGASKAIAACIEGGVPLDNITISSDGNGSMAVYDELGRVEKFEVATLAGLQMELVDMVKRESIKLSEALLPITLNTAKCLGIEKRKGSIQKGLDADITILDDDLMVRGVIAKGKLLMSEGDLMVKGTFE